MKLRLAFAIGMVAAVLSANAAFATVIWDQSPTTTGATVTPSLGVWVNDTQGQNFADTIRFTSGATLTGMDIYSGPSFGSLGDTVTIRLWSDNNGSPGMLLDDITTTLSVVDNDLKHAEIASLLLAADTTYWIGMSGRTWELGLLGLDTVDDGLMAQFSGNAFSHMAPVGDMAFRLEGTLDAAPVPEPGTVMLLGVGLAGVGLLRIRKQK